MRTNFSERPNNRLAIAAKEFIPISALLWAEDVSLPLTRVFCPNGALNHFLHLSATRI